MTDNIHVYIATSKDATGTDKSRDVSQFLAALGMSFWDTTNPFADREETMLPEVQNPTVWCAPMDCWWTHARMPREHAEALQRVWDANRENPEFTGLIKEVRILWPLCDMDGVFLRYSAEEPTWEEPILDEDGNPYMLDIVDEDGTVIGKRAQTWTRRVGDIG